MTVPTWAAALPGNTAYAGQVNQFLGTHSTQYAYAGTAGPGSYTGTTGSPVSLRTQSLAQTFTSAGSTIGSIQIYLDHSGAGADVTVSLQTTSGGVPSGTIISALTLPAEWSYLSGYAGIVLPFWATVSASTLYAIVIQTAANQTMSTADYMTWYENTELSSGAYYLTPGGSWTAISGKSFYYVVYSQPSPVSSGIFAGTVEDAGARVTCCFDAFNGVYPYFYEYTAAPSSYTLNQLTRGDASFASALPGTWTATNASLGIVFSNGVRILVIYSTASGVVSLATASGTNAYVPVIPGDTYTGMGMLQAMTVSRTWTPAINWYNSAGTLLSTSSGSTVADSTTAQLQGVVTAVAPTSAAWANLSFTSTSQGAGEYHYLFNCAFVAGSSTAWTPSGTGTASARTITVSGGTIESIA